MTYKEQKPFTPYGKNSIFLFLFLIYKIDIKEAVV